MTRNHTILVIRGRQNSLLSVREQAWQLEQEPVNVVENRQSRSEDLRPLWLTAAGGFLGANLAGVLGNLASVQEHTAANVRPWIHGGLYAGTILFFVGAITGHLRFINGSAPSSDSKPPDQPVPNNPPAVPAAAEPSSTTQGKRSGILSGALSFGFFGGLLGAIVGGSLLIYWFSLAYSPFAPQGGTANVEVRQERNSGSAQPRTVHSSSHPVVLYVCIAPAVLGAAVGAVSGGIGAALGKVEDG